MEGEGNARKAPVPTHPVKESDVRERRACVHGEERRLCQANVFLGGKVEAEGLGRISLLAGEEEVVLVQPLGGIVEGRVVRQLFAFPTYAAQVNVPPLSLPAREGNIFAVRRIAGGGIANAGALFQQGFFLLGEEVEFHQACFSGLQLNPEVALPVRVEAPPQAACVLPHLHHLGCICIHLPQLPHFVSPAVDVVVVQEKPTSVAAEGEP